MDLILVAAAYAMMAGIAIPAGALLASVERIRPNWLAREFRHTVIAFGGGALIAAVALVLVPEGTRGLPGAPGIACFVAGAITFFLLDRALERHGGTGAQLIAMLSDFLPEALALGAMLAAGFDGGLLLAFLIALQNLPEGFNAYRELVAANRMRPRLILIAFALLSLLGPAAAVLGALYLADQQALLSGIMLFAAGGILYLIFQDIAPQAALRNAWAPALGSSAGFALGMVGHAAIG